MPADEMLVHQIADTFATVSQSDRSWTEKIWATAASRDGSLQVTFGLGVYPNRGVTDGFAGISRGVEQWTVRSSGRLGSDPTAGTVGPLRYEILKPLEVIRFSLAATEALPIEFDWTFEGAVPPGLERREQHRAASGRRISADVVRYHQVGSATGWVSLDGVRTEISPLSWVCARDHSWGIRYGVGSPVEDASPEHDASGVSTLVMWCPVLCEKPDGSRYALHWYYQRHSIGSWSRVEFQGGVELPDGRKKPFASVSTDLAFNAENRRFKEGSLEFRSEDGSSRPIRLHAVSDTGFHLGAGLYMGYENHWHGQWRGEAFTEGEYHPDCSDPEVAPLLHQLRDCVIEVEDPVGGGTGWGVLQSIVAGAHPDMGLGSEGSFV